MVKPQHFLRAKEGSLNLRSIPFHNDVDLAMYHIIPFHNDVYLAMYIIMLGAEILYPFIMMYILLCTRIGVLVFYNWTGDIESIPKSSYVVLSI